MCSKDVRIKLNVISYKLNQLKKDYIKCDFTDIDNKLAIFDQICDIELDLKLRLLEMDVYDI